MLSLVVRTPRRPRRAGAGDSARRLVGRQGSADRARRDAWTQLVAASEAERRFALTLFEAFGLAALVLAAIGIYGVLSGSVTERTREIGVRAALGASRRTIVSLVLRQALALTAIGIAIGVAGGLVASRALATLLFGVSRADPATYAVVVSLLAAVSTIACWVPAWRAARIDPAVVLKAE